ncbi:MAG: HAMP domain-containing sensor histidine kinase [Chromatiales bacterium]|jgi:signal transduction histidine kinase
MRRARLRGLDRRRLALWLTLFFLALALPTAVLVHQAYSRLKWETFHQYQVLAKELAARIGRNASRLIAAEGARPFEDYAFLTTAPEGPVRYGRRSPLSDFPVDSPIPGLIGYFQVDALGLLSTPLLPPPGTDPADFGIGGAELGERVAVRDRIQGILSENRLVGGDRVETAPGTSEPVRRPAPVGRESDRDLAGREEEALLEDSAAAEAAPSSAEQAGVQSAFDRLNEAPSLRARQKKQEALSQLGRVDELKLEQRFELRSGEPAAPTATYAAPGGQPAPARQAAVRSAEGSAPPKELGAAAPQPRRPRVTAFETEIDSFELSLLDSGHFVLFRRVWRDGRRYVQGALIERQRFLRGLTEEAFREAAVSRMSDLVVAWQGNVFAVLRGGGTRQYLSSAKELDGELLYQTSLSAPLDALELIFSVNRLPAGPGGLVITWVAAILALVLLGGFVLMYRLGLGQIELARQQQDFVSAVSHELKTPLTSIRMYGEMLREGWAPEEKRRAYYEYIHDEAERLSRLIANVLQLARMSRNELRVEPRPVAAGELMDGVRSKVSSQIERAGFELSVECGAEAARTLVEVDPDAFTQILINLVDNALKFSARADTRRVDIACRRLADGVQFSVRDYGPGVPRDQMKKIFRLFYRPGDELTRETVGTGIGLALVHQLAQAMGGEVDVLNARPGAELRARFPAAGPDAAGSAA